MVAGPQTLDEIYRYIIVNDLGGPNPADVTLQTLLLAFGAAIGGGGSGGFVSRTVTTPQSMDGPLLWTQPASQQVMEFFEGVPHAPGAPQFRGYMDSTVNSGEECATWEIGWNSDNSDPGKPARGLIFQENYYDGTNHFDVLTYEFDFADASGSYDPIYISSLYTGTATNYSTYFGWEIGNQPSFGAFQVTSGGGGVFTVGPRSVTDRTLSPITLAGQLEMDRSAAYNDVAGTMTNGRLLINVTGSGGQVGGFSWLDGGTEIWRLFTQHNIDTLTLYDEPHSKIHAAFTVGTTAATALTEFNSSLKVDGNLGVFGTTPVVQQTAHTYTGGYTAGTGTTWTVDGATTGNIGTTSYTVADILTALKAYGILAP